MPFVPPDPTQPADSQPISQVGSVIRSLKQYLVDMLGVSFDLTTGALKPGAVPNGLPTPYGSAGKVLTSAGAGVTPTWNTPGNISAGFMMPYGNATPPAGWLPCDGSVLLIATYPGLAAVLGTTFGGDGITTFGVPDTRGRTVVGLGLGDAPDASGWTQGRKAGEEGHTLITDEIPSHTHSIDHGSNACRADGNAGDGAGILSGRDAYDTGAEGGGLVHNNLQPSIGIVWCIKT